MRVILRSDFVLRMALEAGIADPIHVLVGFQEIRYFQRILAMPFHAQWQRLQTLQEQPGVEWSYGGSQVAHKLDTRFDDVGDRAECFNEAQTVIGGVWLNQSREAPVRPIERAAVYYDTANRGAMPTDKFGGRVNDDIGPVL